MMNNDAMTSDEEIVGLYWERDERAIEKTDRKYRSYLFTVARNIIYDEYECDECLTDTYYRAWNRIPPTRPRLLHAFLSKITRELALDRFRKHSAAKRIPSELVVSMSELDECVACDTTLDEELLVADLARLLNQFVAKLSATDEYIFVCRYYYSDKISVIARCLGINENTVHRHLSKMRGQLKELLEREGFNV